MAGRKTIGRDDVLLVVDPQNDFCPGGALAVAEGDLVMPLINRLAERFDSVVLTQDWHPPGHASFASSHPGTAPFETIQLGYGVQTLWPDHCVQGTEGAAFHPDLDTSRAQLVIRKGFCKGIDSYSAFFENDHETTTGLAGYLRERGFRRVFLVGLALDYCVCWSADDAVASGFEALVIEDASRPVALGDSVAQAQARFRERGVSVLGSGAILG